MGGSRRKYKKSRPKVQVGLPKKDPRVFKPAFSLPPKLLHSLAAAEQGDTLLPKWDDKGSVIHNYKSFGVVSNPNLLSVRSRTSHIVESDSLQVPPPPSSDGMAAPASEFDPIDSGSDLEEDDLKAALGKKRRDEQSVSLKPLTRMQRFHVGVLIDKYGDDYESMFMDTKLNALQHSRGTLEKLCKRYHMYGEQNPLIK